MPIEIFMMCVSFWSKSCNLTNSYGFVFPSFIKYCHLIWSFCSLHLCNTKCPPSNLLYVIVLWVDLLKLHNVCPVKLDKSNKKSKTFRHSLFISKNEKLQKKLNNCSWSSLLRILHDVKPLIFAKFPALCSVKWCFIKWWQTS